MPVKNNDAFEELYLKQKRKSSILIVIAIILVLTTIGSLFWGISKPGSLQPPAGFQGSNGQGFPSGGQRQIDFSRFFRSDGSVDTEAVQDMVGRLPSGADSQFLDRFKEGINQAAKDGDITNEQADALIKAFESATGSVNES